MKNICIYILFLILIGSHSEGQIKTFSEVESIKKAIDNSRDIKIAESRITINKAKVDEASSLFLPQLKFSSGYTRLNNVGPFVIKIPLSPLPVQISDAIVNSYNFRLSLTQPLFTGNRLTSLKKSGSFIEKASEEDFVIVEKHLAMRENQNDLNLDNAVINKTHSLGSKVFVIDIDGVIASLIANNDYALCQPISKNIEMINALYRAGHRIVLFTARGSMTGIDWSEITRQQLTDWQVLHHDLKFGKPAADFYIDDRMILLDETSRFI